MLMSLAQRHAPFFYKLINSPRLLPIIATRPLHQKLDKWLPWEDDLLRNYVQHNGKKWTEFSQHVLPNRTPTQCKQRWSESINPDFVHGPFTAEEKAILEKAVATVGKGQWVKISETFLPHRSPQKLGNEWSSKATINGKWTKEEDELILKAVEEMGTSSWTKISTHYLPWRTRMQIRNHFRCKLDPTHKKGKWTEYEMDQLLRRTIVLGQDWNKVAEGLEGRTPEDCSRIWMTVLDPGINKGPWSKEETLLFWERLQKSGGSFIKAAEGLQGRNRLACFSKFWETVKKDKEFSILYGNEIKRDKSENRPMWRARVAKIVCEWIHQDIMVKRLRNKSVDLRRYGPWSEQELAKLNTLVNEKIGSRTKLETEDWKSIAEQLHGRDFRQCKQCYDSHLSLAKIKKGAWDAEECELLKKLVEEYGTSDWDKITENIPNRNKRQCSQKWHRDLQYNDMDTPSIAKNKRLTSKEKSLILEGVQMFGRNWVAIRSSYLPDKTPEQIMRWWSYQQLGDTENETRRRAWTEEEDKTLKFAVEKYADQLHEIVSWAQVAKLVQKRTPKQCRMRWLHSLKPDVKKGRWTYEEEMELLEAVQKQKLQKCDSKSMWPLIAKELSIGRTDWACRSKFSYMQRKGHRFAF